MSFDMALTSSLGFGLPDAQLASGFGLQHCAATQLRRAFDEGSNYTVRY